MAELEKRVLQLEARLEEEMMARRTLEALVKAQLLKP